MGRPLRTDTANTIFHVINRANARAQIFDTDTDYNLFVEILEEAKERIPMRIIAFCLMPNHWHLVLQPLHDGDLSRFMNWVTLTHTQRWHVKNGTTGQGHLYQGRFKSFICQESQYFIQLVRYVERNALRASLVRRAEEWPWSSAWVREKGNSQQRKLLSPWPVMRSEQYLSFLNTPQTPSEEEAIRTSIVRGNPYGESSWVSGAIKKYQLETTVRPRGRPRKGS